MSSKPSVSVLIPVFNQGLFIAAAIESVFLQDYPQDKIEIVVVDDGSTDGTAEIVAKIKASESGGAVRYVRQENQGQASAVKRGIGESSGKYCFLLNADDVFLSDKLKVVTGLFEKDQSITHITHPVIEWQDRSNIKRDERIPSLITGRVMDGQEILLFYYRRNKFYGGGSTIAGITKVWKALEIPLRVDMFIDEYLAIMSLQAGRAYIVETPLSLYRIHSENYSRMNEAGKIDRNVFANEAILNEMTRANFDEEIKALYGLKCVVSRLKAKEIKGEKKISDIAELWFFVIRNRKKIKTNILELIKNYRLLQRSFP